MVGHGPHKYAGTGKLKKYGKENQQHQRYPHTPDIQIGNLNSPEVKRLLGENIKLANIVAPQHNDQTSQNIGETDGDHNDRNDGLADKRPQYQTLNRQPQDYRKDHGEQKRSNKIETEIQRH